MLALSPSVTIFVIHKYVDFRNGIDGLSGLCREILKQDPTSGALFVFRNKGSNAVKILCYDSTGFWLCMKRLSKGSFKHWPKEGEMMSALQAKELSVLLWNGDPFAAKFQREWKKIS
jgi:transposase